MAFLCPIRIRRNKKKYDLVSSTLARQYAPLGRITGSASVETLVRVGIEKENGLSADSKMIVLHDFSPCVDDELKVLRGQIVSVLYRENDWVYVISDSQHQQQEGFIPFSYCAALEPQIVYKKKMPRSGPSSMVSSGMQDTHTDTMEDNHGCLEAPDMLVGIPQTNNFQLAYRSRYSPTSISFPLESASHKNYNLESASHKNYNLESASHKNYNLEQHNQSDDKQLHTNLENRYKSPSSSVLRNLDMYFTNAYNRVPLSMKDSVCLGESRPFYRSNIGRFIVLFSFYASAENDICVDKGEMVTVLNKEDANWSWVIKKDSTEGFVPALYICPIEILLNANNRTMLPSKVPNALETRIDSSFVPRMVNSTYVSNYKTSAYASNSLKYS